MTVNVKQENSIHPIVNLVKIISGVTGIHHE